VMTAGAFRRFEHDHHFATMDDGTRMRDEVRFSAPWGTLGRLATKMFFRKHLKAFLMERNAVIKRVAESDEWRKYLADGMEGQIAASIDRKTTARWDGSILLRSAQGVAVPPPRNS
jgi:hypothetical protein